MAAPRPRPSLAVVREGNPGHAKLKESVKLPPADLAEPDWSNTFREDTEGGTEWVRCRAVAAAEWARVVPVLTISVGIAAVDLNLLQDYCVCVARIDQCERALSRDGLMQKGERGWQKNGHTTIVTQYRSQLRAYIVELGLSPSSRVKLPASQSDDDEDRFYD